MGKKDKKKDKKKRKDDAMADGQMKLKSECCQKFEKGEDRRCKRCPMFDLIKKVA
ncbi:MAG TPA: hypothetical protein VFQ50_04245 [Flavobacterium sp.]|nr:hypothetical protein [Flavobacterium sp.]